MKLRAATAEDIIPVTKIAMEFYKQTKWHIIKPTDIKALRGTMMNLINSDMTDVLVVERGGEIVGAAGIMLDIIWCNLDFIAATELFWYVLPDNRKTKAGGILFRGLEDWANEKKADGFIVASLDHMQSKRLHNVYTRKGFECTDQHYIKEL
jgi:hypothetical protein